MARPPYVLPPPTGPIQSPPDTSIPWGIPPAYWTEQKIEGTADATGLVWPGALLCHLSLPLAFHRQWRLVLSPARNAPVVGGVAQPGIDPLVTPNTSEPQTALTVAGTTGPVAGANAANASNARALLRIGPDVVYLDWPQRGAVYSIATNKLDVYAYDLQAGGGPPTRPVRFHAQLQLGHAGGHAGGVDRPTCTVNMGSLADPGFGSAAPAACSVPPRATTVRIAICDETSAAGPPAYPTPIGPNMVVMWTAADGSTLDSFHIQSGNMRNTAEWPAQPYYDVPAGAAFLSVWRVGGGGSVANWTVRATFGLSL
jgi:hypothetical protein